MVVSVEAGDGLSLPVPVDGSSISADKQNQSLVPPLSSTVPSPILSDKVSSLGNDYGSLSAQQCLIYSPIEASGGQVLANLISSPYPRSDDVALHDSSPVLLPSLNPPSPPSLIETLDFHSPTPTSLQTDNPHTYVTPISAIMPQASVSAVDRPYSQLDKESPNYLLFDHEENRLPTYAELCPPKENAAHPARRYDCEGEVVDSKPWTQPQRSLQQSSWSEAQEPKEIVPTGVGAGISNLGNTCFLNSILQCFTHTVPLVQALQTCNHPMPCQRSKERFCLICVLRDHIQLSLQSSGGVISPSRFVDNLSYFSSFFQKYQQEDAHEFLQSILDKLERCCLESKKMDENLSSQDINIVEQVFGGRLLSRLWCCNCGHHSDTYEALVGLSLEIEEVDTLQSALSSFTSVEKLDDPDTKFNCENCKERVLKEKQLMVDQAPSVAALHLKRFKNDGIYVDKIFKHVKFPLELDLQPYTSSSQSSEDAELKYYLYAFVEHVGGSLTSGHYFCYVRSSPNTWHKLDDSQVTRVEEDFVLSQDAYILFYARQDTPWFSTIFEEIKSKLGASRKPSPNSVLEAMNTDFTSDHGVEDNNNCDTNKSSNSELRGKMYEWSQVLDLKNVDEDVFVEGSDESNQNGLEFRQPKDDILVVDVSLPPMNSEYEKSQNVLSLEKNSCDPMVTEVSETNSPPPGFSGPDSSGIPTKRQEAVYCIPRDHLKSDKKGSRKRVSSKSPIDMNRSLALRCLKKHIPGQRAMMLSAAMGIEQNDQLNKRTKSQSTPCKTSSPSGHRGNNGEQVIYPAAAVLR